MWNRHAFFNAFVYEQDERRGNKAGADNFFWSDWNITGKKVELFRPPYGDYDDELIKTASELGYYTIQWDVDSLDWKDLSASDIAMRVINGVKNGSIILMHNNGLHTAEAVPIILETLKNRGYSFVPVGELILRENYYIDGTGMQKAAS